MEKIQELKKLKDLLDDGAISQSEFKELKSELLNGQGDVQTTNNNDEADADQANSFLRVKYPGQWFLFDMKTKIIADGNLIATESLKKGFSVDIPLKSDELVLKVLLGRLKSTTFSFSELDRSKSYELELEYDNSWGKFSKESQINEVW